MRGGGGGLSWHSSRPAPGFADPDAGATVRLVSPLSAFGILLEGRGGSLSLHLGAAAGEEHHITSLPDVESSRIGGAPPVRFPGAVRLGLRDGFARPLCSSPAPCRLYGHAADLPDFLVGLVAGSVDSGRVAGRIDALARRLSGGGSASGARAAAEARKKLAHGAFFACRILAACGDCGEEAMRPLLSSVNFTRRGSGANALVRRGRERLGPRAPALLRPPRMPRLLGGRAAVLSAAEIASVLPLPPGMRGVQMRAGAERTFATAPSGAPDPAAPFRQGGGPQ